MKLWIMRTRIRLCSKLIRFPRTTLPGASIFFGITFLACQQYSPDVNKFADSVYVKIRDYQDKRLSDSVARFLTHHNPLYRKEAAMAFASIQDTTMAGRLENLLSGDGDPSVRQAAAFALGQMPGTQTESALRSALLVEKDEAVYSEILESYGKVATTWDLKIIDSNLPVPDAAGWSLYRWGLNRSSGDSLLHVLAASLLDRRRSHLVRLGGAHYFARSAKDFDFVEDIVRTAAENDTAAEVRMASALALRKLPSMTSRVAAEHILVKDKDYRVRVNAIRALQAFPYEDVMPVLNQSLTDENCNVGIAASEVIKALSTKDQWKHLAAMASAANNWRIRVNLLEAAMRVSGDSLLAGEVMLQYRKSNDPYEKAALLMCLQYVVFYADFIMEELIQSSIPLIRSTSASALVAMNHNPRFDPALRSTFASYYINAMQSGDPAVIGTIAAAIADPALGYRDEIHDLTFLYQARQSLSLPKDHEAMVPLSSAIALLEGKTPSTLKNEFNHPIDWALVRQIPRNQVAEITTTKGKIIIRLLVEEAPGSVSNFVKLVNDQYFNDKTFHRTVPNFVIQAGCNRGDGWGSEAYSIRSEFTGRRYTSGSVGMASSGKDTEGTQWFITHSPTPHLDGRYTIFAEVESGMEVVHKIEVGDKILNIELK